MINWEILSDQPLWQKLIKKWFWLYFFMFLTAPVGYIIKVIISNTLSVEDVGIFYSVLGFILLVSIYNDLWLTESLQYFLPKYWINKEYNNYKTIIYTTLWIQVISWVLISLLMYFWADRLAIHHFKSSEAADIIKTLCRYFIGINFLQVIGSIYMSFQNTILLGIMDFARMYGILWFTIFFWLSNTLNIGNFSKAWISWLWIGLIVAAFFFLRKYIKTFQLGKFEIKKSLLKKQLKYAFRIFLWANVTTMLSQIDQQIVINFLWPIQAWYYTNYFTLVNAYTIIITPLLAIIFPIVTELITKNELDKLSFFQNLLYKYSSVLVLSIWGLFMIRWPEIASTFFGTKFLYSWSLLQYSAPFLVVNVLFSINYAILAWLWKAKQRVKILAIALLVNVIWNIVLILWFKMWLIWAVISTILWWIILRWMSLKEINKHLSISFDFWFFFRNLIVICLLCFLYYTTKWKFFVVGDWSRAHNLLYFLILTILYYSIILIVNYNSVMGFLKEIKKINK